MRMTWNRGALAAGALFSVLAGAAHAGSAGVFDTLSMESVATALKSEGYAAELIPGEDGGDDSVLGKMNGFKSHIIPYDDGHSIQFYVCFSGTSATLEKVNEWNRSKRFSRSYLDSEGDPCLELDLDLAGGIARDRLIDYFKTCAVSFDQWHDEVAGD